MLKGNELAFHRWTETRPRDSRGKPHEDICDSMLQAQHLLESLNKADEKAGRAEARELAKEVKAQHAREVAERKAARAAAADAKRQAKADKAAERERKRMAKEAAALTAPPKKPRKRKAAQPPPDQPEAKQARVEAELAPDLDVSFGD
jgi:hypothetical protein